MHPSRLGEPHDMAIVLAYARDAKLRLVTPRRARLPAPSSPVAISVVRNEMPRLGEFLRHYRVLGIERFIFVDNGSTDGTPEYLGRQPDIDLFTTGEPFDTQRKQGWIHRLIDDHGRDRWYLVVDADEHVVFAGDDRASLGEVAAAAQARGATRVRGCLVDMYAEGPILATCREPGTTLRDTYGWFDPGGYAEHRNALLVSRVGGPRRRVLGKIVPGFEPQLTKYPLFRPRAGEVAANPHYIWPGDPSPEDRCHLGILHFKFDGDFLSKIDDAVGRRQYWRGSVEYRAYQDALRHDPLLSFHWAASRRYRSARDLLDCGLIEQILDDGEVGFDAILRATARRAWADRLAMTGPDMTGPVKPDGGPTASRQFQIASQTQLEGIKDAVERLHAAIEKLHQRQDLTNERLSGVLSRVDVVRGALVEKLQSTSDRLAVRLAELRQEISSDLSPQPELTGEVVARFSAAVGTLHDRQATMDEQLDETHSHIDVIQSLLLAKQRSTSDAHAASPADLVYVLSSQASRRAAATRKVADSLADSFHASMDKLHQRQKQMDERLAEAQTRIEDVGAVLLKRMRSMFDATAASLTELERAVPPQLARQAVVCDETAAQLAKTLNALEHKSDAAIEVTLLSVASLESDLTQLRRELVDIIEERLDYCIKTVIAGYLKQLAAEIARSVGRQFGELRATELITEPTGEWGYHEHHQAHNGLEQLRRAGPS